MSPVYYYAFIDGSQKGPFTAEQLVNSGIRPSTYVWSKGMEDWVRADSVDEIRNIFKHHLERKAEDIKSSAAPVVNQFPALHEQTPPPEQPPRRVGFPLPETPVEEDINRPPQVSMTLSVLSLIFCFPITGIISVVFTYKAQKAWEQSRFNEDSEVVRELREKAHEYERLAKMWLGLTLAFGIIFWTLVFSIKK